MTSTVDLLVAAHGPAIPLDRVGELVGMSPKVARRAVADGTFPVPAFRARPSQKAPFLVLAEDVAALLERRRDEARALWEARRGGCA